MNKLKFWKCVYWLSFWAINHLCTCWFNFHVVILVLIVITHVVKNEAMLTERRLMAQMKACSILIKNWILLWVNIHFCRKFQIEQCGPFRNMCTTWFQALLQLFYMLLIQNQMHFSYGPAIWTYSYELEINFNQLRATISFGI